MKKLNITKEQFNRSNYFQRKYGKLEYVSESGKMFKTNKGKVLMFNEGIKFDSDFDDDLDDDFDDEGHLDADEDNPKFSIGDKVIWDDRLWKVVDCWYDSIEGSNLYDLKGLDTREETSDVPGDELCAHDGGIAYESTRKFGKKFNEGRLARKLNSGELFEKQMPSLGKAIQKFIDSDGRKGQAGTWNIVSDDDGSIKLYEHYGYWFGTIVDGHMKWADEKGFYVSAKYSEMILNALCDGGLIERDECQRAIEDAYAREGDYEKEYGESTKKFVKEARVPEWLNSFEQARDFVDKACEQLEVVAFEGGADVGNPIHKKLLRIQGEMRDVIESA